MPRGIFCIEGLWEEDLRKTSTVQPILFLLKQNQKIPFIYRDCAVKKEFQYYISKFPDNKHYPILYLAMHDDNGTVRIRSGSLKATELTISDIGDLLKGKCKNKI
jgi:hypothetical protein